MRSLHPRRRPRILLTALAAIAIVVGTAGHAYGQPSPTEIEDRIDKAWNQIEPKVEALNELRIKLQNEKKQADELGAQLAPLQLEVDATRGRVGIYAEYMYTGGRAVGINAYLSSGDPTILAERLSSLDQITKLFNSRITDVLAAKTKLEELKKPLDDQILQLSALEAEQAAQVKVIEDEIDKLNKMRAEAYGSGGGLGNLRPVPCPTTYPGGDAGTAIKFACSQIGKWYKFATDGPSTYDCSGLVKASWEKAGESLPHQSRAQRSATRSISRSQLEPGDIVFYYSPIHHVAMYAGKHNGVDWIVHASRAGEPVKMREMDNGSINSYGRVS